MHRRLGWSLLLGVLALAVPANAGAQPRDTSVAYHATPTHVGEVPGSRLKPPLVRNWARTDLGQTSYALVADGKIVVTAPVSLEVAGTILYALDAETGRTAWSRTLGGTSRWSGAAYEDGHVFAVTFDGLLRAFDIDTGDVVWANQLPGQRSFTSPPTARDGVIYTAGAGSGGTLYAVDAVTGTLRWSRPVVNGDNSSPAVDATRVFVSYRCPNVFAFERDTGAPIWRSPFGCSGGGGSTPALHAGRLYVRDHTVGLVMRASDGRVVDGFAGDAIPALSGTTMVHRVGSILRADRPSAHPAWEFTGDGTLSSAPLIANGTVYVGSRSGLVFGLDLETGAEVWRGDAGAPIPCPRDYVFNAPMPGLSGGHGRLAVGTDVGVTVLVSKSLVGTPVSELVASSPEWPEPITPPEAEPAPDEMAALPPATKAETGYLPPGTVLPAPAKPLVASTGPQAAPAGTPGTEPVPLLSSLRVSAGRGRLIVTVTVARSARLDVRSSADAGELGVQGPQRQLAVGRAVRRTGPGATTVSIPLSRQVRAALRRRGHIRIRVLVVATRRDETQTVTRSLLLRR